MMLSLRRVLFLCGVLSSPLYLGTDLLAVMRWPEYRYASQTVSELMAIDAPTRPLLLVGFSIYDALVIAFGFGVWASTRGQRALSAVGGLLIAYGAIGFVGLWFTPMHLRGVPGSATDALHIVVTVVISLTLVLMMGLAAGAGTRNFRYYSIATIAILVVFGALTGLQGPQLAANQATPTIGALERVNIYATLLWVATFALAQWRAEGRAAG